MLRAYVGARQDAWVDYLSLVEFAYNSTVHASTGATPFLVSYGYEPRSPLDVALGSVPGVVMDVQARLELHKEVIEGVRALLVEAQDRVAQVANAHRRDVRFAVGDKVLLSTENMRWSEGISRKFVPKYLGPFTVSAKVGEVTYQLQLPSTMKVYNKFHVSLLRPWVESDDTMFPDPRDGYTHPGPVDEEDNRYLVESLVAGPRRMWRKVRYLVRWFGYGPEHDKWEPIESIDSDLIDEYHARTGLPRME
jgi:hypothetical protein